MSKGLMIAFDGGNGAGKTTVIGRVGEHLRELGYPVVFSREPGGTAIGDSIRSVILNPDTPEMSEITESLLFAASRAQHVRQILKPEIEKGSIVLCDRFTAASYAFQHYSRGVSFETIKTITDIALGDFKSDMNLILDIDPIKGNERVLSRGEKLDRVEMGKLEFHIKAREGFIQLAKDNPENYTVIDASQHPDDVLFDVLRTIHGLIEKKGINRDSNKK